jgi:predicted NBD/HSP70 family sugar kinase
VTHQPGPPTAPAGGPLTRLRRGHEDLVLDLLRRHGPLSRGQLGQRAGLSRTTLYAIVGELVADGAVVASPRDPGSRRRGRPVELLTLNPAAGQAIGVDFARRAVHVAAVNVAHEVIGSVSEAHPAGLDWETRADLAVRLVRGLAEDGLSLGPVGRVGAIGVGVVGPASGPADAHRALRELLGARLGAPVLVDNNTRLAALAEATWGAAADVQDVLYLRLSHGVGGGLVVGGSLHRGVAGISGEFGHIALGAAAYGAGDGGADGGAVRSAPARRCECGGTGCLETVASVGAVLDAYRERGGATSGADLPALLAALAAGDPVARAVLAEVGAHVGAVLAAVCGAVGPSTIVIGGELAEAGDALFGPVERALDRHLMPAARPWATLRRAALGEAGGALGGIALVLRESPLLARYAEPAVPAVQAPVQAPVQSSAQSSAQESAPALQEATT